MFSITTVLFIVYFLSDFSDGQRDKKFFRQDYTYLEAGDGFYRMQRLPRTWFKAKVVCAQEGSSLFFPETNAEAEAVLAFWQHWSDDIDRTLLGMSDLLLNGEFVTLNGKPASKVYNKWKPGEPNGLSGNEHCVNWQSDGLLNDCPCDYKDYFICKKSLKSLEWNYLCNMPYMDYTYNNATGKCYKVHTTPVNWIGARAGCDRELTTLATVSNKEEAEFLARLVESTPVPRTTENYLRGVYHMGFQNIFSGGWTKDGYPEVPMHFGPEVWWGNYVPKGNGQCGSMFFNGQLNTIDCENTLSFFICEKVTTPSIPT